MILLKIKRHIGLFLLGLLSVFVYRQWFFNPLPFTWGDWGWYFNETASAWLTVPQIWTYTPTGGVDIGLTQFFTTRFLYSLLASLGVSSPDKLVYFFPSIFVPLLSSYYFSYKFFKSTWAALISSALFTFNTYMTGLRTGHFTLAVAFALAPVIISIFMEALETLNLRKFIICGLICALSFSYEPRAFFLISWILGGYFLYHIFVIDRQLNLRKLFKSAVYSISPFIITASICLFGLVGLAAASGKIYTQVLNRQLFGSASVNVQRGFNLTMNGTPSLFKMSRESSSIDPYLWLIPIVAVIGLWIGRRNKQVVFFGLVSLVGIFFLKQSNQPFGEIYVWLYSHVPGFNAFRETSKFYFLISIGYMVLIGNFVSAIESFHAWSLFKRRVYLISVLVLLLLPLMSFFYGSVSKLQVARKIPNDYLIYKQFIQNNYGSYRTLLVPNLSRWAYWDSNIRVVGESSYVLYDWSGIANYHEEGLAYNYVDHAMSILEQDISPNLLNQHSVKYVIIPPEDKENDEAFIFNWGPRSEYITRISKLDYLSPINIGTQELLVYENKSYRPIIYWTSNPEQIKKDQVFGQVEAENDLPTSYALALKNIPDNSQKIIINFSEGYDARWRLRAGKVSWFKSLIDRNHFLDILPQQSEIFTNYFEINPSQISLQFPDVSHKNSDGTFDLRLSLYFPPQASINLSVIISIISFVSSISLLIYFSFKKIHQT